jgi:hypothetical protein
MPVAGADKTAVIQLEMDLRRRRVFAFIDSFRHEWDTAPAAARATLREQHGLTVRADQRPDVPGIWLEGDFGDWAVSFGAKGDLADLTRQKLHP